MEIFSKINSWALNAIINILKDMEDRPCEDGTEKDLKLWLEEQSDMATSQEILKPTRSKRRSEKSLPNEREKL